jgi:enoyl-[acyl-carrier protein] reductase I
MPLTKVNWVPNDEFAVGKGATIQQFSADVGGDRFEINVAPWGEGQLIVNGREIARTAEAKDRRQAFTTLKQAAERYVRGDPVDLTGNGKIRLIPTVKAKLQADKSINGVLAQSFGQDASQLGQRPLGGGCKRRQADLAQRPQP